MTDEKRKFKIIIFNENVLLDGWCTHTNRGGEVKDELMNPDDCLKFKF